MGRMVLEVHDWRQSNPDDDNEIIALFLFTLMPATERQSGVQPSSTGTFWTEVRLSRDLAARGRWQALSKQEKLKAMLRFAQESIIEAGGKLREAPMFWTPGSPLRDGPPWDLSAAKFPKADPVVFEAEARDAHPSRLARAKRLG